MAASNELHVLVHFDCQTVFRQQRPRVGAALASRAGFGPFVLDELAIGYDGYHVTVGGDAVGVRRNNPPESARCGVRTVSPSSI